MINEVDCIIHVPPYVELDSLFIQNAILGMKPVSSMALRVTGNEEVGIDVIRVKDEVYLVREVYYNVQDWHFLEGRHPNEIVGHFECVHDMHTMDSEEEKK